MKKLLLIFPVLFLMSSSKVGCDELSLRCYQLIEDSEKGSFLSDGQVYKTFLNDRESTELTAIFFEGNTYRIACAGGLDDNYVHFTVRSYHTGEILFDNADFDDAQVWDFKVEATQKVVVEAEFKKDLKNNGCLVIMLGFEI